MLAKIGQVAEGVLAWRRGLGWLLRERRCCQGAFPVSDGVHELCINFQPRLDLMLHPDTLTCCPALTIILRSRALFASTGSESIHTSSILTLPLCHTHNSCAHRTSAAHLHRLDTKHATAWSIATASGAVPTEAGVRRVLPQRLRWLPPLPIPSATVKS